MLQCDMSPKVHTSSHQRNDRRIFFMLLLLGSAGATVWLLQNYISVIILSMIFSIVVHPLYLFTRGRFRLGKTAATLTTISISFFLIIMPIILSINLFVQEIGQLLANGLISTDSLVGFIEEYIRHINALLASLPLVHLQLSTSNIDTTFLEMGTSISKYALDQAVAIGSSSLKFVINFFIFFILAYFTIPVLPEIRTYLMKLSPLGDNIDSLYIDRLVALIVSMVKSIFIIAFAQGLLAGLFLWIAGVDYILTLTVLMIIMSIIPVFGTALITVPIGIYLLIQGNLAGGAIVLLGQTLFVSNIDNVLRAELLSRNTSLHPAIMLMAIFGGMEMFGAIGLIYGPIIVISLLTSLQIYMEHYKY